MARLQQHREEQAKAAQQTAALVQMLQETHRALIASNQTLMAQLQEEKRAHADEVSQMHRNFEALKRLHARGDEKPSPPDDQVKGRAKAKGGAVAAKPAAARRVPVE